MVRISIRELLVVTALMAIAVAAAARNIYALHCLFNLLIIVYLSFTTVEALVLKGHRRIAAIGGAVFGWAFISTMRFSQPDSMIHDLVDATGLVDQQHSIVLLSARNMITLPMIFVGKLIGIRLVSRGKGYLETEGELCDEPQSPS